MGSPVIVVIFVQIWHRVIVSHLKIFHQMKFKIPVDGMDTVKKLRMKPKKKFDVNEKKGNKMLYRIRKNGTGVQLYSTGGETVGWKANGKIWSSLSAFASHLALQTKNHEKMERKPLSLFKLYGDTVVVMIPESGVGNTEEMPFAVWYDQYFNTSEKFRAARKAEKSALTKTPDPKPVTTTTMSDAQRLTAQPVVVNKPKGWDVPTKNTIKRALDQSAKFVPNVKFQGFSEHPKTGESYGIVEISGKRYALLEL